jgi:hypothetical protein
VTKAHLWLVGAVAVLVLGLGWSVAPATGAQVTECGVDAHGVYAKVRVNNLLGFYAHQERVDVAFSVKATYTHPGDEYEDHLVDVWVPAHGRGTAVVHGRFPAQGVMECAVRAMGDGEED